MYSLRHVLGSVSAFYSKFHKFIKISLNMNGDVEAYTKSTYFFMRKVFYCNSEYKV